MPIEHKLTFGKISFNNCTKNKFHVVLNKALRLTIKLSVVFNFKQEYTGKMCIPRKLLFSPSVSMKSLLFIFSWLWRRPPAWTLQRELIPVRYVLWPLTVKVEVQVLCPPPSLSSSSINCEFIDITLTIFIHLTIFIQFYSF